MLISPKNDLGFTRTRRGRHRHGLCSAALPLNSFTSSRKGPHICAVLGAQWRDSSFQGGFNYCSNRTTPQSLNKTVFHSSTTFPKTLLHKYLKMSLFLCCDLQVRRSQAEAPPARRWHPTNSLFKGVSYRRKGTRVRAVVIRLLAARNNI